MNYEDLQAKLLQLEAEYGDIELEGDEGIILVKEGDWISGGKYEHRDDVYASEDKSVFAMASYSRTGSYFTDYEHSFDGIVQVEPVEKVIIHYKPLYKK